MAEKCSVMWKSSAPYYTTHMCNENVSEQMGAAHPGTHQRLRKEAEHMFEVE
jgi:hypothetical protein